MKIKLIISIALSFLITSAFAKDQLVIDEQQIKNVGLELAAPVSIQKSPLFTAPAKITIPPTQDFIVSTPYSGVIERVIVSVGDEVKEGQVLARLFSPEFLELQRDFLAAFSEHGLVDMKRKHDEMLYKEGVISHHRLIESRITAHQAEALLSEHKELLKMSGLSDLDIKKLARKRKLINHLKLLTPTTGVILDSKMVTGQQVERLVPVFRVANLQNLFVELAVPQERLVDIRVGGAIEVGQTGIEGTIILIGRSVDEDSQTVLVRAVIDEYSEILNPGQNVTVQLFVKSEKPLFKVPTSAIISRAGAHYLFIRTATGFEAKSVKVMGRDAAGAVIEEGLQAGDKVVVKGTAALKLFWLEMEGAE